MATPNSGYGTADSLRKLHAPGIYNIGNTTMRNTTGVASLMSQLNGGASSPLSAPYRNGSSNGGPAATAAATAARIAARPGASSLSPSAATSSSVPKRLPLPSATSYPAPSVAATAAQAASAAASSTSTAIVPHHRHGLPPLRRPIGRGFDNLGNTCFMNSTLQVRWGSNGAFATAAGIRFASLYISLVAALSSA